MIPLHSILFKILSDNIELNAKYTTSLIESGETIYKSVVAAIVIISLIVNIVIGYAMIHNIRSSISELRRVSAAVAKGDLTVKVKINSTDELGKLGQEYNQMIVNTHGLINQIQRTAHQKN